MGGQQGLWPSLENVDKRMFILGELFNSYQWKALGEDYCETWFKIR